MAQKAIAIASLDFVFLVFLVVLSFILEQFIFRDHLESLISKHGYPTPVSLSSLRDLTSTSSAYSPPPSRLHRYRSDSPPVEAFDSLSLSSTTRPIPIPRRSISVYDEDLPVTPLTGRFDKDDYFEDWERASLSAKSRHTLPLAPPRRSHYSSMRSDHSPYYSPVASPTMSPRQPGSPQTAARARGQTPTKAIPNFQLGSLPRFHPAVYQPSTSSQTAAGQSLPSRQTRSHNYRPSSGPREVKWQYRDLLEGSNQSPSAPRLDPLRSPGPVTPLALEAGDYLAAGSGAASERVPRDSGTHNSGPSPDLIERLIAREKEAARQKSRIAAKGR
ncbi:hypothetical protein N7470_002229 [Penicillium chermesinum]|nr:hypothetical protein N7470_002229 [Penicillium chermesinum]